MGVRDWVGCLGLSWEEVEDRVQMSYLTVQQYLELLLRLHFLWIGNTDILYSFQTLTILLTKSKHVCLFQWNFVLILQHIILKKCVLSIELQQYHKERFYWLWCGKNLDSPALSTKLNPTKHIWDRLEVFQAPSPIMQCQYLTSIMAICQTSVCHNGNVHTATELGCQFWLEC